MNTTFFLDIDQTLSSGHVGRDLAASIQYYRAPGLEIPDGIQIWPDLFQLPEVVKRHEMLPGALAGVMLMFSRRRVPKRKAGVVPCLSARDVLTGFRL